MLFGGTHADTLRIMLVRGLMWDLVKFINVYTINPKLNFNTAIEGVEELQFMLRWCDRIERGFEQPSANEKSKVKMFFDALKNQVRNGDRKATTAVKLPGMVDPFNRSRELGKILSLLVMGHCAYIKRKIDILRGEVANDVK